MAASQKVCRELLLWDKYISAERILAYYPCRNELDIRPLLTDAFERGKTVAFPKVTVGQMVFITVSGFGDLKPGCMNIPEPVMPEPQPDGGAGYVLKAPHMLVDGIQTLMLVPGVAFCKVPELAEIGCVGDTVFKYGRMGYGGGYYDRYLRQCRGPGQNISSLVTCGVAYDFQLVPPGDLPLEAHDMLLDHLIFG